MKKDFLFEILTEELPPRSLEILSFALAENLAESLEKHNLHYKEINAFATPRRLAIFIEQLDQTQPTQTIERRGPAITAAFDAQGKPTPACIGFAKSCRVTPDKLATTKNAKGEWVVYQTTKPGKDVFHLMPALVREALKNLPIDRLMRWCKGEFEFVRPVHSIILMFGSKIIPAEFFGIKSGKTTLAHRFLSSSKIKIKKPSDYEKVLQKHFVIADFTKRKEKIKQQILDLAKKIHGQAQINDDLLNEVTALVEWPEGLLAKFPARYLQVPDELLISSIQQHQKCFPIKDKQNKLLPNFITISNIKSKHPKIVVQGNERVMNARLNDAEFFYQTDLERSLVSRVGELKSVVFQQQLGSLYDKTKRLMVLVAWIAELVKGNQEHVERAAYLSKIDLLTQVVGEFPELQGIMGYYYALQDQEPKEVALAIREQYMPINANAELPQTLSGQILAIADRIDTMVGIFGIGKAPTGDKDPFALRRAAIGIIRIIIENKLDLNLQFLLEKALDLYGDKIKRNNLVEQILQFIYDRLKTYILNQDFSAHEFAAVFARKIYRPYDFYRRILAVKEFFTLPVAGNLATANKRVSKILTKEAQQLIAGHILDKNLLKESAEIKLAELIVAKEERIKQLAQAAEYVALLQDLAELQQSIDDFFDHVMVMVEDKEVCANRLLLLSKLRELFLQVADISLIPK
jgi:glycyl-tRNA synthetase beta chain